MKTKKQIREMVDRYESRRRQAAAAIYATHEKVRGLPAYELYDCATTVADVVADLIDRRTDAHFDVGDVLEAYTYFVAARAKRDVLYSLIHPNFAMPEDDKPITTPAVWEDVDVAF